MYVLGMVGIIILFIKEMYGNKNKNFSWSGAFSVVGYRVQIKVFLLTEIVVLH